MSSLDAHSAIFEEAPPAPHQPVYAPGMVKSKWSSWASMIVCGLISLVTMQVLAGGLDLSGVAAGLVGLVCALLLYASITMVHGRQRH